MEILFYFLCSQKHIYLLFVTLSFDNSFLAVQAPLALPLESCSVMPICAPPPHLLIPLHSKNQTALKQIDVLFNIVVTSSQGPHTSASVTTAGLLSLAQR